MLVKEIASRIPSVLLEDDISERIHTNLTSAEEAFKEFQLKSGALIWRTIYGSERRCTD